MISKNALRKLKNNYLLKIFKINKKNIHEEVRKILKNKNNESRIKEIKNLKDKYPSIPKLQLLYAHLLDAAGKEECFKEFEKYSNVLSKWKIKTGLVGFKTDFISSNQFTGSLGCCFHIFSMIKAKEYNLLQYNDNSLYSIKHFSQNFTSPALVEYFKKYIHIVNMEDNIIFNDLINFLELPIGMCLPMKQISPEMKIAHNSIMSYEKKNNLDFSFKLNNRHNEIGEKYLSKLGYSKESFIVTLHVRESGYHDETDGSEDFRNGDIFTYIPAIKHIISNGGIVFRMGDPSMKKTPRINGLVDYANSAERSDILDVYLGAKSKFCIGTSSGYSMIPYMFDVPILFTNMGYMNDYFMLREKDYFIPKRIFNWEKDKFLSLEDMFTPPNSLAWANVKKIHKKLKINLINNTEEELLSASKEVINDVFNKKISIELDKNKIIKKATTSNIQKYTNIKVNSFGSIPNSFIEINPYLLK